MTAIENFKQAQHEAAAINKKMQVVNAQLSSASDVITAYCNAQAALETAKNERRELLAAVHLGKAKPDMAHADKAVNQATKHLDSLADAFAGAETARKTLEHDLHALQNDSARIAQSLPELRYQAALEEASSLICDYQKSADETEQKLAVVAGALMVLEKLRNSDMPPFAWRYNFSLELSYPDLPLLNCNGYQGYRSHMKVLPAANDARDSFAERLARIGIA